MNQSLDNSVAGAVPADLNFLSSLDRWCLPIPLPLSGYTVDGLKVVSSASYSPLGAVGVRCTARAAPNAG